jgi:hypothetical protein
MLRGTAVGLGVLDDGGGGAKWGWEESLIGSTAAKRRIMDNYLAVVRRLSPQPSKDT